MRPTHFSILPMGHQPVLTKDGAWRVDARCAQCGTPMSDMVPGPDQPTISVDDEQVELRSDVMRCADCGNPIWFEQVGRSVSRAMWWKPWTWFGPREWQWRGDANMDLVPPPR